MWEVARRPRWIGVLVVCLAIAAAFAALGQWQLGRAVEDGTIIERETETVVALESVAEPQKGVSTEASGQLVEFEGRVVAGDFVVVGERFNEGEAGYWLVARVETAEGAVAVALGWAPSREAAASASSGVSLAERSFSGRYLATEPPTEDDFENGEQKSVSVAALVNQWREAPDTVYGGYLTLDAATPGLETIDSPAPRSDVELNWLNIFYAIEWVIFAGFAIFLWFRLVKDEWEREQEDAAEAAQSDANDRQTTPN